MPAGPSLPWLTDTTCCTPVSFFHDLMLSNGTYNLHQSLPEADKYPVKTLNQSPLNCRAITSAVVPTFDAAFWHELTTMNPRGTVRTTRQYGALQTALPELPPI